MSQASTPTLKSELLFILLSLLTNVESARILAVLPSGSLSHHIAFKPLITELVKQKHEVTVLTPFPLYRDENSTTNLTQIDLSPIIADLVKKYYREQKFGIKSDVFYQIQFALNVAYLAVSKEILRNKTVQDFLNNGAKFDIVLIESFCRMALAFSSIYKAPLILISSSHSVGAYNLVGAPEHPLFYPACNRNKIFNLTVTESIRNIIIDSYITFKRNELQVAEDKAMKSIFPGIPSIEELKNDVSLFMVNVNPLWEGNRPVPSSVIHLGGMHVSDNKELPTDLKDFLDTSVNGVVYISFGTNFKFEYLLPETFNIFMKVLSQLPHNILWKCDSELSGHIKNIRTFKWLPQANMLRHPKIKLFITQAGLHSTDEAISAGVPLLGIPIVSDQWGNAELYEHHKIGLKLELPEITEETLNSSIYTLISDATYRSNIDKLRAIMNDQRQRPLHRAVRWIENVIKHRSAAHLRSPGANLKWPQYYEVELIFMLLCFLCLTLYTVVMFVQLIYRSMK